MEAESAGGEQHSKQDKAERNGAPDSEKHDKTPVKENPRKPKSSQRKSYTQRQRKEFQGKSKDSKREPQVAAKFDLSESQKTLDSSETERKEDVIGWLNKKISKQEDSSSGEKKLSYDKDKPMDEKRNKNQKFMRQRDKKFVDKERIKGEEEEQHGKTGNEVQINKSESEKPKQRSRNKHFRPDAKYYDSRRGGERKEKLSSREGRDKQKESLEKPDQRDSNSSDTNVVEIGANVNVVNGKYVGKRENPGNHHSYLYNNQYSGYNYPQDYYYQEGFQYGGVYGAHYFQPYGMELNYPQYPQDINYYGNMNHNYYQGYQPQNQEPIENHPVSAAAEGELSKPKNNRQRYPFKGYRNRQIHGDSNVDPSHSEQAGMLTEQLQNESYECMVCCDKIWSTAAVWSCDNCYHVFHLKCARKWARSPMAVIEGILICIPYNPGYKPSVIGC